MSVEQFQAVIDGKAHDVWLTSYLSVVDFKRLQQVNKFYLYVGIGIEGENTPVYFGVGPRHQEMRVVISQKSGVPFVNMTICQLGILNSQITSLVCEQAPGITPDDSLARVRHCLSQIEPSLIDPLVGVIINYKGQRIARYNPQTKSFG